MLEHADYRRPDNLVFSIKNNGVDPVRLRLQKFLATTRQDMKGGVLMIPLAMKTYVKEVE